MSAPVTPKSGKAQSLLPGAPPPSVTQTKKGKRQTPTSAPQDPLTSGPAAASGQQALELEESFDVCRGLLCCTACKAKGSYNKDNDRLGARRLRCKKCQTTCTLASLTSALAHIEARGQEASDEETPSQKHPAEESQFTAPPSSLTSSEWSAGPTSQMASNWGEDGADHGGPTFADNDEEDEEMSEDDRNILPPNINSPPLLPLPPMPTPVSRKRPALQDPDQSMMVQRSSATSPPRFVNHEAERLRKENADLKAEMAGLRAQLTAV